jgi:eukaryotic-like serine/threonine-protein kinase
MRMARVGEAAPEFALACADARDDARCSIRRSESAGRWLALVFYPRDFSFVCPTELTSFSARWMDFAQRNCDLLGISVDSVELHREWLQTPPSEGGLGPLQFPLASDPDGSTARDYGVWVEEKQVSTRGLFLIDPDGILQYAVVHNLNVGRTPDEVLRVLDALQTGGLCPASWTSADGTIDPELALLPGRILGHYRIRQKLGSGTFGTVFAAWDLRLERMVALKVLKRNVFESRDAVLAEARTAAKVNVPNVCTIYAVEEEDGLPLIAMEYLEGRTLSHVMAESLTRDAARTIAVQIASGLVAAHAQQVVHGDLKPANVIVSADGTAKILDFGLAGPPRASGAVPAGPHRDGRSENPHSNPTNLARSDETLAYEGIGSAEAPPKMGQAPGVHAPPKMGQAPGIHAPEPVPFSALVPFSEMGRIRGTPAYMSPEQAAGHRPTPASDVFAFGLMWFEMLTGRRAQPEMPLGRLLARLRTEDLAPGLVAEVDPSARDLLAAMLTRDAAKRPEMSEVLRQLAMENQCASPEMGNGTLQERLA